jgi:hypothetical protein
VADLGPLPGLSELLSWTTDHLTEGADYLDAAADRADSGVIGMWNDLHTLDWQGETADAERARVTVEKDKVCPVAGDLRAGSAETALEQAARQAQAHALAGGIRQKALRLFSLDTQIGRQVTTVAASLHTLSFAESPGPRDTIVGDGTNGQRDGTVRLVDNTTPLPEAPGQPFPEAPWNYDHDFTSDILLEGGPMTAGQVSSIDDAWRELHRCFNCNFPIGCAPRDFPKVGQELPLEVKVAGVALPFPVKVTQVEKSADQINIEFATLPGHVDGVGSTIHFTFLEQGGQLHLKTHGYITGGPTAAVPGALGAPGREFYSLTARQTWQPYIDRLTYNIAKAKGYGYSMVPP